MGTLLRLLAFPLALFYGLIIRIRNKCFDLGIVCKTTSFPIPVISLGNLTVGGTGKTGKRKISRGNRNVPRGSQTRGQAFPDELEQHIYHVLAAPGMMPQQSGMSPCNIFISSGIFLFRFLNPGKPG